MSNTKQNSNSVEDKNLLSDIFQKGRLALNTSQESYACEILSQFIATAQEQSLGGKGASVLSLVEQNIAKLDKTISEQLNEVIHHDDFLSLEGNWRGLSYLVSNSETGEHLKLRLLTATKDEIADDLDIAIEFDQSSLFKKVYEEEYGTFGGHPYSCLVTSFSFGRSSPDMELLSKLSNVAAAAHTPLLAAAAPKLFDLDSFQSLHVPRDLEKIFESIEMVKWQSFRESEDSRYVTLLLPRVLMRLPYGDDTLPVKGLNFKEHIYGAENSKFCWSSPAFIMAQRIAESSAIYGWPATIRGVEGGGLVKDLPAFTFKTVDGDIALKCPTEVAITDRREKELSKLGFLPLCYCKGTDYAAFFGGQTSQKPKLYNTDEANANAQISARLPYLLAASRFAHYIKSIMRDKIGSYLTKEEVAFFLNDWIAGYVILNDGATQELKAKYPLREASIEITDLPGKPGSYKATIFLRPHMQLEELTASIRLVATLPAAVSE